MNPLVTIFFFANVYNEIYSLVIDFLTSKTFKLRSGVEVGQKAVEYFRGQDFIKWVVKHQTTLRKKVKKVLFHPPLILYRFL